MRYVTSVERIGIKKGIQQGMQQGIIFDAQAMVIEALDERFGNIAPELQTRIKKIGTHPELKKLLRQAIKVRDLAEFEVALDQISG